MNRAVLQGSVANEYVVVHEVLAVGMERLQGGPPIVHRMALPLGPGRWFLTVQLLAGLANVSASVRLEGGGAQVRTLGGAYSGALNPHFGPAHVLAHFDDVEAAKAMTPEIVIQFDAIAPTAIALVGQRTVSVTAWKRAEAQPARAAAPKPKPPAPPPPRAAPKRATGEAKRPAPPAAAPAPPAPVKKPAAKAAKRK